MHRVVVVVVAPAAVGFPVIILLLIPLRTLVVPRLPFSDMELEILDRPTASPFVSCFIKPCESSTRRLIGIFFRPCNRLVDSKVTNFGATSNVPLAQT
jgi:hypothetical protein